ncbi:MAG: hypothetical protein SFW66_03965 [Gammaproteobacteria bacterium]|nr:hypothetical protein [Gammaproteobacteria bacterium]
MLDEILVITREFNNIYFLFVQIVSRGGYMAAVIEKQMNDAIEQLKEASLNTEENRCKLEKVVSEDVQDHGHLEGVVAAFKKFNFSKVLATQENFDFVFEHADYGGKISWYIDALIKAGSHLVTQENFNKIAPHICESYIFSNIYSLLCELTGSNLSTQENFDKMIRYSYSSDAICGVLGNLSPVKLNTQENLDVIFEHAENSKEIASATHAMKDKKLLTQKNFLSLIPQAKYGEYFFFFLLKLDWAKLANQHNFDLMIKHAQFSKVLSWAFENLYQGSDGKLANQKNLDQLFQNAVYAGSLAKGFNILAKDKRLTQDNFNKLIKNPGEAEVVAKNLSSNRQESSESKEEKSESSLLFNLFSVAKKITNKQKELCALQAEVNRRSKK